MWAPKARRCKTVARRVAKPCGRLAAAQMEKPAREGDRCLEVGGHTSLKHWRCWCLIFAACVVVGNFLQKAAGRLSAEPLIPFVERAGRLQVPAAIARLRGMVANPLNSSFMIFSAALGNGRVPRSDHPDGPAGVSPNNPVLPEGCGRDRLPGDNVGANVVEQGGIFDVAQAHGDRVGAVQFHIAAWNIQGGISSDESLAVAISRVQDNYPAVNAIFLSEADFIQNDWLALSSPGWQVFRYYPGEGSRAMCWIIKTSFW